MKKSSVKIANIGIVLVFVLLVMTFSTPAVAYAADEESVPAYVFDKTDVMQDLNSSEGFDASEYPARANGILQIHTFLEYGYSYTEQSKNYSLYIYIYNPQQKELSRSSASNRVNIAVDFDDESNATSYYRLSLIFCSASDDNLFYKYRIDDSDKSLYNLAREYANAHDGVRRYDISNVEFLSYGESLPISTKIGKSYECKGFMKGFGPNEAVNTFECSAFSIDVLELELNHTFFRPEGNNTQQSDFTKKDQLDSVYFSFPNELIEYYGGIWKIEASYYMAKTSPILVTSTKEVYDVVKQYLGQKLQQNNSKKGKNEKLNNDIPFLLYDVTYTDDGLAPARPANCRLDWNHNALFNPVSINDQIVYYLFYTGNETSDGSAPYAKDFTLSAESLFDYIYNYDASYRFGASDIQNNKGGYLSMDLFQGALPTGETSEWFGKILEDYQSGMMPFVPIEITAEDNYTIESYKRTPTAFDWFPLYKGEFDYSIYSEIPAIEPIDINDISLSKEEFCARYYVDESSYEKIIQQVKDEQGVQTVYLFRFAQSDYTSKGVLTEGVMSLNEDYAYVSEQTVYLDMNIASVTCRKGDSYHTFAVCSNPINAGADVDPNVPFDDTQWYKTTSEKIKDFFAGIKDWFVEKQTDIIIALVVIVCVLIVCAIVIPTIKHAYKNDSPPKPRKVKKKKPGRRKT